MTPTTAPSDVQQKEQRQGRIEFHLPMSKKASYVKAAHASGKKLVPWMLEQLDAAAEQQNSRPA